nr:uncharacterized protein LOC124496553 [Dermatophagoides farinae]
MKTISSLMMVIFSINLIIMMIESNQAKVMDTFPTRRPDHNVRVMDTFSEKRNHSVQDASCQADICSGECINGGKKGGKCTTCNCDTCEHWDSEKCYCDRFVAPWSIYHKPDPDTDHYIPTTVKNILETEHDNLQGPRQSCIEWKCSQVCRKQGYKGGACNICHCETCTNLERRSCQCS